MRRAWLAAAVFGVAGCAAMVPRAPTDLSGRLALRVEAPAHSFSADFDLRGDAERGQLHLTGPLGTTLGEAQWQPGAARLRTGESSQDFVSLDALSQSLFGQPLPLAALVDWLRGRPWPGAASTSRTDGFEQLGWAVDLSRYAGDGVIVATRERDPKLSVRVRLEPRS